MSQILGSRSERCSCRGRLVLQRCRLSARLILTISQYVTICISPHTRHCRRRHQSPAIQLLSQTDIRWDQLLLVPAASSLRSFLLMCRALTRSSRSIHLLLIPSRRQSLNADPCGARARGRSHAHKLSVAPAVPRVLWRFLPGLSERNDYHTSVSTCHRALPESAMSPSPAPTLTLTDSSIGCFMLMQIVGGRLCARLPVGVCVCELPMLIHNAIFLQPLLPTSPPLHPTHSITAAAPYLLCHCGISGALNCFLSSAESGDTYQRQVLSIFSIASGICLLGVACMALYRRNK